MRRPPALLLALLLACACCGCKTFHGSRFYISRVVLSDSSSLPTLDQDKEMVEQALDGVASTYGLLDARPPGTEAILRRFMSKGTNPVLIESKMGGHFIFVDVSQVHSGLGKSAEFDKLVAAVKSRLGEKFEYRLKEAR